MRIQQAIVIDQASLHEPQAPRLSVTRRIDHYLQNHEAAYQRMARVRACVSTQQTATRHAHCEWDRTLAHPERYQNPVIRALIHIAKIAEELAESFTDISGLTERIARNLISSGEKPDLGLVIGSAVGRIVSGQLSWPGFALHKAIGASLYAMSTVSSAAALSLSKTRLGALRHPDNTQGIKRDRVFDGSIYEVSASRLLAIKHKIIKSLVGSSPRHPKLKSWASYMLRGEHTKNQKSPTQRRSNCNYMWQNLHQYGCMTRALMHCAYGIFQGVNKVCVAFDKHCGTLLSSKLLSKRMGELMGTRLAMTLTVGAAAALSVPMAPLSIGLSSIGAIACGVAFIALLAAKANVKYNHDWEGDIGPPAPRIRSWAR